MKYRYIVIFSILIAAIGAGINIAVSYSYNKYADKLLDCILAENYPVKDRWCPLPAKARFSGKGAAIKLAGIASPDQVAPRLIKALYSRNKKIKLNAIETFKWVHYPEIAPSLAEFLSDKDDAVRFAAVATLAEYKGTYVKLLLLPFIKDPHSGIRSQIAIRLGKNPDPDDVKYLKQIYENDPEIHVKLLAIKGLNRSKKSDITRLLISMLSNTNARIRAQAAHNLAYRGDRAAIPYLIAALEDPVGDVGKMAAYGLGQMRTEEGFEALITALKNKRKLTRRAAADVLAKFADKRAIEPLKQALNDSDWEVRYTANRTIKIISNPIGRNVTGIWQSIKNFIIRFSG
ncbi:MAG: HEAT repeat domain-containing protein [Methyloligellaceae bacterium]